MAPNDNIWDDEDDDEQPTGTDLVKQLRKQLKEATAARKALDEELKTLRPTVRNTKVADVLKSLNVDTKYTKLVPSDLEASEENLKAWAEEFGFVSAGSTETSNAQSGETNADTSADDETIQAQAAAWQRIQSQQSAAGTTTPDNESQQIAMLQAAEKAANGNTDLLFAYLSGEKPIPM